jgi:hypothetical protein
VRTLEDFIGEPLRRLVRPTGVFGRLPFVERLQVSLNEEALFVVELLCPFLAPAGMAVSFWFTREPDKLGGSTNSATDRLTYLQRTTVVARQAGRQRCAGPASRSQNQQQTGPPFSMCGVPGNGGKSKKRPTSVFG